jgi:hypothetical protein
MRIIINAQEYVWVKSWISYSDVLELIGKKGTITIQYYSKFLGNEHHGTLTLGDKIIASDGMIIDAVRTDNA